MNELQFLRSENTRLKEEIKGLEEKVKQLSTALIAMPSEDAKVGVTWITSFGVHTAINLW